MNTRRLAPECLLGFWDSLYRVSAVQLGVKQKMCTERLLKDGSSYGQVGPEPPMYTTRTEGRQPSVECEKFA